MWQKRDRSPRHSNAYHWLNKIEVKQYLQNIGEGVNVLKSRKYNENKTHTIKLTELDLKNIIKESVKNILNVCY